MSNDTTDLSEAVQEHLKELTPTAYLYERARQIQEQVLPHLEQQKAQIEEAIKTYKVEMVVLEAASKILPPDRIALNPEPVTDNVTQFPSPGGVN